MGKIQKKIKKEFGKIMKKIGKEEIKEQETKKQKQKIE